MTKRVEVARKGGRIREHAMCHSEVSLDLGKGPA